MKRIMIMIWIAMGLLTSVARADGAKSQCGADAVPVGSVCLDTYEASVWRVPNPNTTNAALVKRIQLGIATRSDLTAGGATQLGAVVDADYAPCTINGQNCADDIFAVSLPSEIPAANITWFQAQEACANAGKRLPTNAEWQMGATGTPDPDQDNGTTDCNTGSTDSVAPTGSRSSCVSARGAFDMVGNLYEWVADWAPASTTCVGWASFSDDDMCLAGASTTANPGALMRGGTFAVDDHAHAGVFAVRDAAPFLVLQFVGFRCAR
jgi:formylglycine-generating enzyme required for sulfatase activity